MLKLSYYIIKYFILEYKYKLLKNLENCQSYFKKLVINSNNFIIIRIKINKSKEKRKSKIFINKLNFVVNELSFITNKLNFVIIKIKNLVLNFVFRFFKII